MTILHGDSLQVLKRFLPNSVDAVVTDPPYGLSFMNKKWDYDVPSVELWREVYRVLKPGGHLLSFFGTRTYHRGVVRIEDAGFEIRDQVMWIYGSGFPKSLDVSKAIDKAAGAQRVVIGQNPNHRGESQMKNPYTKSLGQNGTITAPATPDAKRWQGFGTALKPANEVICVARKPLTEAAFVANLALEICQSKLFAKAVKKYFESSQNELSADANIAQWLAEKSTLTPDALLDLTAILRSELAEISSLNIELLWLDTLAEVYRHANTFTIETATSLTIDLKTLNYCLSKITPESIRQCGGLTLSASALNAAQLFSALEQKLNYILTLSVHENATSKAADLNFAPNSNPIVLARKPLEKGLTVAENVLKWGVGGLNIDASRVGYQSEADKRLETRGVHVGKAYQHAEGNAFKKEVNRVAAVNHQGRWPANVILDEAAAEMLDEQSGELKSGGNTNAKSGFKKGYVGGELERPVTTHLQREKTGGASRFFYVAKASKRERNAGLEGMPVKRNDAHDNPSRRSGSSADKARATGMDTSGTAGNQNHHPTVKPIKLMEYLIKLVTPPGGVVLDPFMGSGSTGVAAKNLGFRFIGIELNEEYFEIAKRRIGVEVPNGQTA